MHLSQRAALRQHQRVLYHAGDTDSYAMFNLLTGSQMLDRVEALLPNHRKRLFPPTETLSIFVAQALSADGSCRQAVNDAAVKRLVGGLKPCSTSTSAYWQARARLPLAMISTLALQAGDVVAEGAASWWHWRGRQVRPVDGATARYGGESGCLSTVEQSKGRPGLSNMSFAGAAVLGKWRVAQCCDGALRREG